MGSEIERLLELGEVRKQRDLTPEEKKELRLFNRRFKKALLEEPDTQPLTGENEISRAERQAIRRQYEQQVPDSPAKTRELRMWDLANISAYERKLTAEERAEVLELYMQSIEEQHPALAPLIREAIEEPTAGS